MYGILCTIWRGSSNSFCSQACFGNDLVLSLVECRRCIIFFFFLGVGVFVWVYPANWHSLCWLQGALALEDALSKGLPIQKELDSLNTYLEGIDKDSLVHLVLSTLPEDTRYHGTDTLLQLNQKVSSLSVPLLKYMLASVEA